MLQGAGANFLYGSSKHNVSISDCENPARGSAIRILKINLFMCFVFSYVQI
jgi:hypothetical protein